MTVQAEKHDSVTIYTAFAAIILIAILLASWAYVI